MSSFIQWNITDFYKCSIDINRILYNYHPQILYFQENNLKDNHTAQINNYTGCFKNRTFAQRVSR